MENAFYLQTVAVKHFSAEKSAFPLHIRCQRRTETSRQDYADADQ